MTYPTVTLDGKDYDIYDIAEALDITSPPLFNAFKKIIRRGNGAKSERQDLEEAKQSIDRYLRDRPHPTSREEPKGSGKVHVRWACPACDHLHSWLWDKDEILDGKCKMECVQCGAETMMIGDGTGFYRLAHA